jgi:hypothetical protein
MWMAFLLLFVFLVLPHSLAFAQTDSSTDTALQRQKELEAQQKSQKALEDFLRSSKTQSGSSSGVNSMFSQFRMAIPKFRSATDDYRWALSMDRNLEKPLKDIKAQADVMLTYLEAGKVRHPKTDPSEFKDYSPAELQWEALNSAERIGAFLDFAVLAERQETVSTKTLEFLYTLDGELLRLKWLTSHVK